MQYFSSYEGVAIGDKLSERFCVYVNSSNNGILIAAVPLKPLSKNTSCKGTFVDCQYRLSDPSNIYYLKCQELDIRLINMNYSSTLGFVIIQTSYYYH